MPNEDTKQREFLSDNYLKYVITLDRLNYEYNGIKHINLIDFLLEDDFWYKKIIIIEKVINVSKKCKLCGKTFNKNNYQLFGISCFKTICELLGVVMPKNIKEKDKEKYLWSLVAK